MTSKSGQIITFYSYKGGTGRTMALVNAACLLSRNSKVLVIDWDLEAPGLHHYIRKYIPDWKEYQGYGGVIDLFIEFRNYLEKHPKLIYEDHANDLFHSVKWNQYISTFKVGKHNIDIIKQQLSAS